MLFSLSLFSSDPLSGSSSEVQIFLDLFHGSLSKPRSFLQLFGHYSNAGWMLNQHEAFEVISWVSPHAVCTFRKTFFPIESIKREEKLLQKRTCRDYENVIQSMV